MNAIVKKPNIWDLHIHTAMGTPQKKYYGNPSPSEFVSKLVEIFDSADNRMGMVSFTDHNKINAEVYKEFLHKSDIAIIPGIEVDVYLSDKDKSSKHIIFYFDEKELSEIDILKNLIETYLQQQNGKVLFEDFIMFLTTNGKRFAISPHAFKQEQRAINFDWMDPQSAKRGAMEFSGLFFPFWEASGKTSITKAIEFLSMQYEDKGRRQAVIAFSDSNTYEKIEEYINNPHQYFWCLNSFKGLLLAGSDTGRIVYSYNEDEMLANPSEKIMQVSFSNDLKRKGKKNLGSIELSHRLNVIIGGRGKGKSAILDAIVASMDKRKIDDNDRRKFAESFHAEMVDFTGHPLMNDIRFLYFKQSYINALFDNGNQDKLEEFFRSEFQKNRDIDNSVHEITEAISRYCACDEIEDVNAIDDLVNIVNVPEARSHLKLKRKASGKKIPLISEREKTDYKNAILRLLPQEKEIITEELTEELESFIEHLLLNICRENYKQFEDVQFHNMMRKQYDDFLKKKNAISERKVCSKQNIENKLRHLFQEELERIRQINSLYEIDKKTTEFDMQYQIAAGEKDNCFFFVTYANMEHPVEYAKRCIVENVNKAKIRNFDKKSISEIFKMYALSEDLHTAMRDGCSFSELTKRISNLTGIITEKRQRIIYKCDNQYSDLHISSPGTQTNAIMEYILHLDGSYPLLIDQPEDNIDNEARFSKLTRWIRQQKYQRQIILVTHDANIVINGDAECVIIANYDGNCFSYQYGAMEYEDIIDQSALILDGGKGAVQRRIEKYGE